MTVEVPINTGDRPNDLMASLWMNPRYVLVVAQNRNTRSNICRDSFGSGAHASER